MSPSSMKKIASLLFLATFACAGMTWAQGNAPTKSTGPQSDAPFAGPLADRRPTPKPTAAPTDNGGKKMVGDLMLATDDKGKNTVTSFPSGTTTIYAVTKNVSGAKGDKVMAEWYADDAGKSLPKGKRFYNSSIALPNTSSYNPDFHVTGPVKGAFPPGKYHVDLSVGKEKLKTAKFSVQ